MSLSECRIAENLEINRLPLLRRYGIYIEYEYLYHINQWQFYVKYPKKNVVKKFKSPHKKLIHGITDSIKLVRRLWNV